jgi:hypothetical protein
MKQDLPERLESRVRALALPGGRVCGSEGNARARDWLIGQLAALPCVPYAGDAFALPADAGAVNVMARIPGAETGLPPVLLAAHYDTCGPQPGADDNAAAVAVALEAAEPLASMRLRRDVVLAFFDAEEPPAYLTPAMGSIRFYNDQMKAPVHAAVVLDLVGHDVPVPGFEDLVFITGMESDPALAPVVSRLAEGSSLRLLPTLNRYIGDLSDHHVFRVNERPYLFFSCGRWQHYHAQSDTPDRLNYAKMAALLESLCELMALLDATDLPGPFEGYDSAPMELALLRRAAGPLLETMGLDPRRREDLDNLVRVMVQALGL